MPRPARGAGHVLSFVPLGRGVRNGRGAAPLFFYRGEKQVMRYLPALIALTMITGSIAWSRAEDPAANDSRPKEVAPVSRAEQDRRTDEFLRKLTKKREETLLLMSSREQQRVNALRSVLEKGILERLQPNDVQFMLSDTGMIVLGEEAIAAARKILASDDGKKFAVLHIDDPIDLLELFAICGAYQRGMVLQAAPGVTQKTGPMNDMLLEIYKQLPTFRDDLMEYLKSENKRKEEFKKNAAARKVETEAIAAQQLEQQKARENASQLAASRAELLTQIQTDREEVTRLEKLAEKLKKTDDGGDMARRNLENVTKKLNVTKAELKVHTEELEKLGSTPEPSVDNASMPKEAVATTRAQIRHPDSHSSRMPQKAVAAPNAPYSTTSNAPSRESQRKSLEAAIKADKLAIAKAEVTIGHLKKRKNSSSEWKENYRNANDRLSEAKASLEDHQRELSKLGN